MFTPAVGYEFLKAVTGWLSAIFQRTEFCRIVSVLTECLLIMLFGAFGYSVCVCVWFYSGFPFFFLWLICLNLRLWYFFVYLLHMRHLIFCFEIKCCHQNECCKEMPEIILIRDYFNSSLVMLVVHLSIIHKYKE